MSRRKCSMAIVTAAVAALPTWAAAQEFRTLDPSRRGGIDRLSATPTPLDSLTQRASDPFVSLYSLRPSQPFGGPRLITAQWRAESLQSWSEPTNWAGGLVPNAIDDTAAFDLNSNGQTPLLDINVNLGSIDFSDPQLGGITSLDDQNVERNTTITLNGPATINVSNAIPPAPGLLFGDSNFILFGVALDTVVAGNAGLTKTGTGPLYLSRANTYTGTTTVNGGKLVIDDDSSLGNPANTVALNGTTISSSSAWNTSRTINIGAAGGIIEAISPTNISGNITGSSSLTISGPLTTSIATFSSANSFSGALKLGNPTVTFTGNGGFANATRVDSDATLSIVHNTAGVNHLPDAAPFVMDASALLISNTSGSDFTEQVGALTSGGGFSVIRMSASGGGSTTLNASALDRGTKFGGFKFHGTNLGQTPGGGVTNIFFGTAPTLVEGLIPYAWANTVLFDHPASPNNTLVTYDPTNGVTPLAVGSYSASVAGSDSTTNVRLETNEAVAVATTINALVLAPDNDVAGGLEITGAPLTIDSGVVLNASVGNNPAQNLNIVRNNLAFGTREAIFLTPAPFAQTGVISGTGGLTKIGGGDFYFAGDNTYTGQTTIGGGFNLFFTSVLSDGVTPGPFGRSTTPIVLHGGNATELNPADQSSVGSGLTHLYFFGGVITDPTPPPATEVFNRPLTASGSIVRIANDSDSELIFNGAIELQEDVVLALTSFNSPGQSKGMVFNGVISGEGTLWNLVGPYVTLNGNNTFSRLDLVGGLTNAGHNNAFGAGSVNVLESSAIAATGGPRTLPNDFILHEDTTLTIAGTQPLTLAGKVDLGNFVSNGALVEVTSTATATFSGNVTRGGLFVIGPGVLALSGTNDFAGPLVAGNGTIDSGMIVLRSNTATGSTLGITFANPNSTIALENNITIPDGELLGISGDGRGGLGALRNLSGNNTWGGDIIGIGTTSNTISVDAGVLTVKGAISTQDDTVDPPLTKSGPGQLNVGSGVFNDGVNDFAGSIVLNTGALNVNAGTVRVTPTATPNDTTSIVGAMNIAGGPAAPTAKLDLSNSSMIINYTTNPSPLQAVRQLIRAGYNNGNWAGNGITSSVAATSPNGGEDGKTGLGYAELKDLPGGDLADTSVFIKYTYFGDSNLDGLVDVADLGNLASNWQTAGTWINGDFDYSGFIDVNDLGLLASNWQAGVGNPLAPSFAEALASVGLGNVAVPEPTALSLLGLAGLAMRRRRQCRA